MAVTPMVAVPTMVSSRMPGMVAATAARGRTGLVGVALVVVLRGLARLRAGTGARRVRNSR